MAVSRAGLSGACDKALAQVLQRGLGVVQRVWQESDTGAPAGVLGAFLGQLLTHWLLILEAWYLVLAVFAPAFANRSMSWSLLDWLPAAPASPEGSEGAEMGFLERAMNR